MKMALSNFIVFLMLNFLCVQSSNRNKRPTISSHSGHLFFQAPFGGNISLETLGGGKVNLNGVDLTKTVNMVLNASSILNKYTINFENSFNKIDEFDKLMFGKDGFIKKVETLKKENDKMANLTARPVSDSKLNRLQHQLNSAVSAMRVFMNLLRNDECKSNPCSNGGTCQDLYNNFICRCPEGWEGQHCDVDVNECSRFVGTDLGCQNGATCINKPGTYQCLCPSGWYGIHCTRRSRDCNSGSSSSLCGHGTCIPQNSNLGYKCLCDQGYTNSNFSQECMDFDECKSGRPPCSVNPLVSCINTPGSFRCGNCPEGFTGNGFYCKDIDECQSNSNVCSKNPLVECINTLGSYICGPCPLGYSGDGKTCTYQGICNVNNGGCHPLATCQENKNNPLSLVQCTCPPGFFGNGMGPTGCVASSKPWSPCDPNPCKNGQCVVTNSNYRCVCNSPYFGKNCENNVFPCAINPCKNGGTCTPRGYSFKCSCPASWTGPTCANERSACGGVISQESGILKYPPSNFSLRPEVRSCAWIIETSRNQILNLKFTEFHMKYTRDCNKDWVQIHDGRNTASHTLGRFCGNEMPRNGSFSTTHNSVYIWFRTDGASSNSGFELSWDTATPTCHFNITTTSHGSIQSPGSPGNYPNNRDCFWKITVPAGKRLLLHFFSFDVGTSVNCTGDYLEVLPSSNLEGVPFAKYCNSSVLPPPLYTPGSVSTLHFHSDDREQHPGFQISYSVVEGIPGCGGTFTNDRGEIRSPSFTGRYLNDLNCEYKIKLAPGLRVKLEFLSFGLEADATCKFDSLKVFEGPDSNSPLIGRYCGNTLPGPYLSEGNEVTILFTTDWATGFEGFHVRYDTVCGGKFTEKSGIIQSDGYPTHYAPRISCLYEIIQPPGYIITLSFLDFQIEHNVEDCFDYVEIRDGDNENSTLIGTYCANPPAEIVSSLNHLWIKFVTDESVGDKGFRANYTATNLGCGGILKDTTGIISPQLDSGITGSGLNCNWVIKAPPGNLIRVIWLTFQLRPRYICDHDYVLVYDNNTISGRGGLIGKYCGSKLPPSFISTSNMVTLTMNLERSSMNSGFTLSYNFVREAKLCGGDFHSPGGVIRYPNDQDRNSVNVDCTWSVTVQPGHQIMLNFTQFSVQASDNCRYHYLEIRNGKSASSPLIGKYCGYNKPKLISSHANQINIHFKIDSHSSGGRFEVIWGSAATGCSGILSAPSGSIVSPMYPEPYHKFTDCVWKISVSSGSLVQIVFTDIDLEAHTFCSLDYVEVFDGASAASKSLGKFCTLTHPTFIRTTQNHAFIHFHSDVSFQGRGFQLQYTTDCHNNVTGFYGVIESPNFPNQYQLPEDCVWNINVENRNKINITFTTFDVKSWVDYSNKTCSSNSLEIKYPSLESSADTRNADTYDLYGKYCGQMETPKLISLDHNQVQIHYSTKTRMVGQGFRLEWALDGCGGKLYKSGTIQSPNYPKGYPESTDCRWVLETDFGYSMVLSFTEIDLERANDCHYDSIQVYNGPDNTYPKLAHFCHQDIPIKVTSNGHKMSLYFSGDSSYQGKGFSANFTSIKSKCGGKLTMSKGSIFSPNYPKKYDRNDTCEWLLEVDENHLIDLVFDDVDLLTNDVFCNKNYIKVYDGPSAAYPVLTKVCGTKKPNTTITSTHNTMLVEFSAGTFLTTKGFMAHFSKACGARINATVSGEIQMHPEFLDNNLNSNCSWTILAPELNQHIALTVTHMDLRVPDCSVNTLRIYEGENTEGKLIGEYCGDTVPGMIISSGNALHIVAEVYIFLKANYEVYDSTCGGSLNTLAGTIISPGFIDGISEIGTAFSESECEWTINVAPGNQIGLTFNDFKIPTSDKCKTDFLEIRQQNSSGKLLGTFCGDKSPADITNIGSLWLYLKISTNEGEKSTSGLKATFAVAHSTVLTATSGQIASPLYPKYFNTYNDYTWRISVTFGKKILIKFKEISLGVHYEPDCSNSGMKIYDGIDQSALLLKALCDYDTPEPVKTSSNEVYISVSFTAGNSRFLIEYEETDSYVRPQAENSTVEGCGSNGIILDLTNHKNYTIQSPGFPNGYANNLNCEWTFSTSSTNHLSIDINWLDLKSTFGMYYTSCNYQDSLEILSGNDKTGEWKSVKKICTTNETNNVYPTSNLMRVKFYSDYSGNATGFKAEIGEECGGVILESEGNIIFDDHHVKGRLCQWNITVPTGKTISVDFPKFHIAPGQPEGCKNYLMLRNGLSSDSPPLGSGKYCGTRPPDVLKTSSNVLSVKYSGTKIIKGFNLHFKAVSYACGGSTELTMFENSTTINSPNYPDVPLPHIDCVWVIRSPPGTSIQLDFHGRFDLTKSEGCTSEFVEVRDGGTDFSPLIGKFCRTMPGSQFSTDNIMYIKFQTDVDDPRNGFKATASLATCGGTHRGKSGRLAWTSDDSRLLHSKNNCSWHIVAPQDYNLVLTVDVLDTPLTNFGCVGSLKGVGIFSVDPISGKEKHIKDVCSKNDTHSSIHINSNEAVLKFKHSGTTYSIKKFAFNYSVEKDRCLFNLNTPSGRITSPGYPRLAYRRMHCKWKITVPEGKRVKLTFVDLDLDESLDYQSQGIVVLDSSIHTMPVSILRLYNGSNAGVAREVRSSANTMVVFYWSSDAHGRGFSAVYDSKEDTVCQGSFNETSGTIAYPNATSFFCVWKRRQSEWNTTLKATATMQLKTRPITNGLCLTGNSALLVYSGSWYSQLSLCSNTTTPAILRTSYPVLNLKIWGKRELMNFTFSYDTYPCGGIRTDESGVITSPNFPNRPSKSFECSWFLKLPKEHQINISFTAFDLGDDCDKSFLEIFNGPTPTAPRIEKFCKDNKPISQSLGRPAILSERNDLLINYHFSADSKGKGFNLTYKPVINGCGGVFHSKSRIIQTPQYPKDYPNNTECVWEIRAPDGYHITLSFTGRFHLEESDNCVDDSLMVWDWRNEAWNHLNTLCGRETPQNINSIGNKMKIRFRSNGKIQARGFQAKWEFNCGGTFEATSSLQYIVSPGYPEKYPSLVKCVYTIDTPGSNKIVNLKFIDFDLERAMPNCVSDNVTIQSLGSYHDPSARTIYCEDSKPSDNNYKYGVKITFMTDAWIARKGFKFSFTTTGCGGNITSPTQISAPKAAINFGNVECVWSIIAPPKKIISVRFLQLMTPYTASCAYDNIVVHDGLTRKPENKLATLCGNLTTSLPTLNSPNNTLTITSNTDPNFREVKFVADIFFSPGPSEGCGGTFNLTSEKTIRAPNVDGTYDCYWQFMVPVDYTIEFQIVEFTIGSCTTGKCSCGFLEIRDGGSSLSTLITQMCNSSVSVTKYQTTTRYGFVRLYMNGQNSNGFRMKAKPIISPCGKSLLNVTQEVQTISSPNYPNRYPDNIRCRWFLKSEASYKKIVLRFKEFDLADETFGAVSNEVCKYDYLEVETGDQHRAYGEGLGPSTVFSGRGKSSNTYEYSLMGVHTFCGRNDRVFDYYSPTGNLAVIFQSKFGKNRGKGFLLEYQLAGCNRNYTEDFGRISFTMREQQDCLIGIEVQGNKTISLYFSEFFTSYSAKCTDDYLQIFDGNPTSGMVLGKWCGYNSMDPVFSSTNNLWLKIHSNKDSLDTHIDITYTSTDKERGCGGNIYDISGTFTSPLYPKDFRKNTQCIWYIRGPPGTKLKLSFNVFDIQGSCDTNYLKVKTYDDGLENEHEFCKGDDPAMLVSDVKVTVIYQASLHNGGAGWTASFKTTENDNALESRFVPLILD